MTKNTNIEWADHTFNGWEGCNKVSPGCAHCYAEARNARFGGGVAVNWGPGAPRRRTSAANWQQPLKWEREAWLFRQCNDCGWRGTMKGMLCMQCHSADTGEARQRVFCSSLADVFDNQVDPQWRQDLFELIEATPSLDWLLLTKRIGNAARMIEGTTFPKHRAWPWPNVWLGATIVNQEEADRDIPKLLATPAAQRFLSIEPMLGPVDLTVMDDDAGVVGYEPLSGHRWHRFSAWPDKFGPTIDWVIVGGESGPNARPMHPDWARSLRDQCEAAGVPFLFKQWGEWMPQDEFQNGTRGWRLVEGQGMERVGKKAAGRTLDGRTWDGFPCPP